MTPLRFGVCAHRHSDAPLMRESGIQWVRDIFPFPFRDKIAGELTDGYLKARESAKKWAMGGMKVMGVSPCPFHGRRTPGPDGRLALVSSSNFPEWAGTPGSPGYNRNYHDTCAWLAGDLKGTVGMWQVANELDIELFSGPLNPAQACELVTAGARGFKSSDSSLVVGHNPSGDPRGYYFFGRLFNRPDRVMDYCGIDGYYASWAPGAPTDWAPRIRELHALTGAPILVNEWGFSSTGGVMSEQDRLAGLMPCDRKSWWFTWGEGHTPASQAKYIQTAMDSFMTVREMLLGMFFYRWEDQEKCWQCGAADCPAEIAWGLTDLEGNPKPSLKAYRDGIGRLSEAG